MVNYIGKKEEVMNTDLQEANAGFMADERNRKSSNNKSLDIIAIENPEATKGATYYVATKLREDHSIYIEVTGCEIAKTKIKNIFLNEADDYVDDKGALETKKIRFPWTRVISIEKKQIDKKDK